MVKCTTPKKQNIYTSKYASYPYDTDFYKTKRGRFFTKSDNGITAVSEEYVKNLIGKCDINKYIELFGEPEEA